MTSDDSSQPVGPASDEAVDRFVQLFSKNQRRVHAYIGALLPIRTDADDVMQETSVALWRKIDDYDPSRDFFRWACGVAYIEVLRHRRRHAKQRLFFSEDLMEDIAEEVLNQSDVAESRSEALAICLKKLNDSDRALVEHRYGAGVTILRTAEDLGRPASTVYKALTRIKKKLLACIRRRVAAESRPSP